MSDRTASQIVRAPVTRTVTELNALPAKCKGLPDFRMDSEKQVYRVRAKVVLVRPQDDGDVHVVLQDATGATIVAEVVDPVCAPKSHAKAMIGRARASFNAIKWGLVGKRVVVTGVGMYDFDHNQAGRSKSCLELHPVLSIGLR